MTADRDAGPMKAHDFEATRGDRHLRLYRRVCVGPALGLVMHLAPLNRSVLLLASERTGGGVCWVLRAGMALDVRGPETEVHYDPSAFRATLGLKRPPAALDRYAVRALWVENDDDPRRAHLALQRLLDRAPRYPTELLVSDRPAGDRHARDQVRPKRGRDTGRGGGPTAAPAR